MSTATEHKYNFGNVGKKLPYVLPPGTFEEIDSYVRKSLKTRRVKDKSRFVLYWSIAISVAASVALLFMYPERYTGASDPLSRIDRAYEDLSDSDQDYLIEIYEEDIFINEQ